MESSAKKMNALFYVISIYVVLTFIWRFLVPATEESEPDSLIYIEIVFEVVQIAALVVLFSYLKSHYDNASAAILISVFLIALVAAIGILVMRFSSDHGWYTGHRIYCPGGCRS